LYWSLAWILKLYLGFVHEFGFDPSLGSGKLENQSGNALTSQIRRGQF